MVGHGFTKVIDCFSLELQGGRSAPSVSKEICGQQDSRSLESVFSLGLGWVISFTSTSKQQQLMPEGTESPTRKLAQSVRRSGKH